MDQLQKFLFEGLPVRGMLVRLEGSWRDVLARRASASDGGHAFPPPVRSLLGQMAAANAPTSMRKLMKPGPAISVLDTPACATSSAATSASAISRGFLPSGRASIIA